MSVGESDLPILFLHHLRTAPVLILYPVTLLNNQLFYYYYLFFVCVMETLKVKMFVSQLYPTLCDFMDCSPPSSSVHGILHARILEWIAVFFSRGIFLTQGSNVSLLHHRQILYHLSHQGSPRLYIVLCNLQITTDWLQIGKGVCQDYVLSPAYLTYMQSTS